MADIKISALPSATTPASVDILPIVSGGVTGKISVSSLVSTALSTPNISLGIGTSNPPLDATTYGRITINGTDGGILSLSTGDTENFRIQSYNAATNFNSVTSLPIIFKAGSIEWMRITGSGTVGIGITSTGNNLLQVDGETAISGGGALRGSYGYSGIVSNLALGTGALGVGVATTAIANTAVGNNALNSLITGTYNTALGYSPLLQLTSGSFNTGLGALALAYNTTGSHNTSVGNNVLQYNTSGSYNVGLGRLACNHNTTGSYNIGVGYGALFSTTTGLTIGSTPGLTAVGTGANGAYSAVSLTWISGGYVGIAPKGTVTVSSSAVTGFTTTDTGGTIDTSVLPIYTILKPAIGVTGATVTVTSSVSSSVGSTTITVTSTTGLSNGMFLTSISGTAITGLNSSKLNIIQSLTSTTITLLYPLENTIGSGVALIFTPDSGVRIQPPVGLYTAGSYNTGVGFQAGNLITTGSNNVILGSYKGDTAPISGTGSNYIVLSDGNANVRQTIDSNGQVIFGNCSTASGFFPNADLIVSNTASGIQKSEPHNIGIVGEGTGIPSVVATTATGTIGLSTITVSSATGILVGQSVSGTGIGSGALVTNISGTTITLSVANTTAVSGAITFSAFGIGVYGKGYTSGVSRSGGVVGEGHVSATGDTGSAIGIRGYSNDTHSGGMNIGLYGDASGSTVTAGTTGNNLALYLNNGDIYSNTAKTWYLNGNLTFSGAYTISANTFASTVATGSAPFTVTSTTAVANLTAANVSGGTMSGTTLSATGAITLNTTTNNQTYITSGAGTITITSGTAGSINNMNIGATTAGTGAFTTLSSTSIATTSSIARSSGLTAIPTITTSLTLATGGITLASQTAAAGSVWRVKAYGTYAAISSAGVRSFTMSCYWGSTQLPAITAIVIASAAQTTAWSVEFEITASSTTAVWTTGVLSSQVSSATTPLNTVATPSSTTVTAGAQTLDFRVGQTGTLTADVINVHQVVIERLV